MTTTSPATPIEAAATLRRCIASGKVMPRGDLVRFVRDPDGGLAPDVAGRLPGRGVWVAAERALIERAAAKGLFARSLGEAVRPRTDLADQVADLLARHWLSLLGLARRAGALAVGFEQVRELAAKGDVGLLIAAADGAPATRGRLRALAPQAVCVGLFTSARLSQALGRDNVVQAAVRRGRLATRLATDAHRLAGLVPAHEQAGLVPAHERTGLVPAHERTD